MGLACVYHGVHAVPHRLLQAGLDLLGLSFVALDYDLVVYGEDGCCAWALVPALEEESQGELEAVGAGSLDRKVGGLPTQRCYLGFAHSGNILEAARSAGRAHHRAGP